MIIDPTLVKSLMIRLFTVKSSGCFVIENGFICLRIELWMKQLTGILPNESKTRGRVGWEGTPCNGLYRGLCLKWVCFQASDIYETVGILLVEVYERVGKSVILFFTRT